MKEELVMKITELLKTLIHKFLLLSDKFMMRWIKICTNHLDKIEPNQLIIWIPPYQAAVILPSGSYHIH